MVFSLFTFRYLILTANKKFTQTSTEQGTFQWNKRRKPCRNVQFNLVVQKFSFFSILVCFSLFPLFDKEMKKSCRPASCCSLPYLITLRRSQSQDCNHCCRTFSSPIFSASYRTRVKHSSTYQDSNCLLIWFQLTTTPQQSTSVHALFKFCHLFHVMYFHSQFFHSNHIFNK